jgi:hypothetical protein
VTATRTRKAATPKAAPRPRLDAADLDLLRAFEPVVRYTKGESFLPMSVATYLASAVRMRSDGSGRHQALGSLGDQTELTLTDGESDGATARDFLTVAGTGADDDVAAIFQRESRQAVGFHSGGGRLARVGYASRVIDALFSISLLARGRVPGSLARRSVVHNKAMAAENAAHPYYGRVARTATWTALQYWFFYAFNDWRSGFHGANDHEADWEQIIVYLDADADGRAVPVWAAYAQHDYHGRDLRRRWDDRDQLDLVGDHPVVYAGAGSHASYFRPGEYLAEQPLKLPSFVQRISSTISRLIRGKGGDGEESALSIPFVDFARGDGVSIGPNEERTWTPVVMDDSQPWVPGYSGLWGMSVEDPFEGEDAPAGPMFNRNRSVRMSWSDPVSFAELDLEPPPSQAITLLRERAEAVARRQGELAAAIPVLERNLAAAGAEDSASADDTFRTPSRIAAREQLRAELTSLQRERDENELRLGDLVRRSAAAEGGARPSPQAHLRRIPVPTPPGEDRTGRLLEAWAAVSVGLMLLVLVGVLILSPRFGLGIAVGVIGLFILIESILRGGVIGLLATWVRFLAVVAAAVVFVSYWQIGIIVAVIAAGLFILRENVGELLDSMRVNE